MRCSNNTGGAKCASANQSAESDIQQTVAQSTAGECIRNHLPRSHVHSQTSETTTEYIGRRTKFPERTMWRHLKELGHTQTVIRPNEGTSAREQVRVSAGMLGESVKSTARRETEMEEALNSETIWMCSVGFQHPSDWGSLCLWLIGKYFR